MTPRRLFRTLAIAEAITWTLLIAGLIVRAVTGFAPAVTIGGGIHGFVFLSYAATAVLVSINQRWPVGVTTLAVVSAVIPYTTIPVELRLDRRGRLAGAWRTEASDDPRDQHWVDRLARWFIRRPLVLFALIAVGVVAAFVILLMIGPPGGR